MNRRDLRRRLHHEAVVGDERSLARLLDMLRDDALEQLAALGCSCRPRLALTSTTIGDSGLPAWVSEHDDRCALAVRHRAAQQARTS